MRAADQHVRAGEPTGGLAGRPPAGGPV